MQWGRSRHFTTDPVREWVVTEYTQPPKHLCLLLAQGWGTASCCYLREKTRCQPACSTATSGWAPRCCLPQSVPPPPPPPPFGANIWNAERTEMEHSTPPSAPEPKEEGGAPWMVLVCGARAGPCFDCVRITTDPSSSFLQQKITFWWNVNIKEGNAFPKNEGFMASSKSLETQNCSLFKKREEEG